MEDQEEQYFCIIYDKHKNKPEVVNGYLTEIDRDNEFNEMVRTQQEMATAEEKIRYSVYKGFRDQNSKVIRMEVEKELCMCCNHQKHSGDGTH